MLMLMNIDEFNSLSPENQEILLTAAENAKQYQREQAQMYEEQMLSELREADMEVVELSESQKQRDVYKRQGESRSISLSWRPPS